jgi:DNA-binding response OmpR family regulator
MRILLIEDDNNISRPLGLALKAANFAVDTASDGEKGYFAAQTNNYSLIILDYNLPGLDGREIIRRLRSERINTPILVLTVRSEINDKVELLGLGADDYLAKPFVVAELLARSRALMRRPETYAGNILRLGNLELDPDKFLVSQDGSRVFLSSKEFALLEYLMKNKGRILSHQEIMENVWDENADPFSNTIEVHISNLRRKLESDGHKLIFTFSNRGYKIDEKR